MKKEKVELIQFPNIKLHLTPDEEVVDWEYHWLLDRNPNSEFVVVLCQSVCRCPSCISSGDSTSSVKLVIVFHRFSSVTFVNRFNLTEPYPKIRDCTLAVVGNWESRKTVLVLQLYQYYDGFDLSSGERIFHNIIPCPLDHLRSFWQFQSGHVYFGGPITDEKVEKNGVNGEIINLSEESGRSIQFLSVPQLYEPERRINNYIRWIADWMGADMSIPTLIPNLVNVTDTQVLWKFGKVYVLCDYLLNNFE